jgi:hypothetical protein
MVGFQNKLFKGNVMIQITALYAAILALILYTLVDVSSKFDVKLSQRLVTLGMNS